MPRTLSIRLLVPVAALALVATACSAGDDADRASSASSPPSATSAPAEVDQGTPDPATQSPAPSPEEGLEAATITIEGFDYDVAASVEAGSEVTVVNNDREAHTFTLGGGADVRVIVQGGASESFTAPDAGTYEVTCDFHGGMTAELVVT